MLPEQVVKLAAVTYQMYMALRFIAIVTADGLHYAPVLSGAETALSRANRKAADALFKVGEDVAAMLKVARDAQKPYSKTG